MLIIVKKKDTVFVLVNSNPILLTSNDQTFCLNSTVNLNASGADSYNWNNGESISNTFSAVGLLQTKNVSFVVTTIGCISGRIIQLSLDDPSIIDAGIDQFICKGVRTNLEASGGINYF